jgi:cob(I)alamin adenosyltransferase
MKIYTKTGDKGQTSIIGGRVDKDDIRVEAYGTIDEVNSFVGQAVAELDANVFADVLADLEKIQHELFDCGGDLANVTAKRVPKLTEEAVQNSNALFYQEEQRLLLRFILLVPLLVVRSV